VTTASLLRKLRRDIAAVLVVGLFMFPLFWWLLSSIKPTSVQSNLAGNVFCDFVPTFDNYAAAIFGFNPYEAAGFNMGENYFDSRLPLLSSTVIALGATALTLLLSAPAAYALSRMTFRGRERALSLILLQRLLPPIAIIVPTVYLMRDLKLYDTHAAIILAHGLMNLPVAVLLLKSFFDDVPREIDDAATIDGATKAQIFRRIVLPMVRGGVAATAVLCFIFSWTEFLLALFLTTSIRTLPVKITTFGSSVGDSGGLIAALGTSAMLPGFIFILLVQKQLARGLSLGAMKD
jgi:multiple sugar transport system permease protein